MNTQARDPHKNRGGSIHLEGPSKSQEDPTTALLRLLQLEADIRRVRTEPELIFHMANESRGVLGFRQAFVFRRTRGWLLKAVSSVSSFSVHAPLNLELKRLVTSLGSDLEAGTVRLADLTDYPESDVLGEYAFRYALWIPMRTRQGVPFAGLLLLRDAPWPEAVLPLVERVAETYSHAWQGLAGRRIGRRSFVSRRAIVLTLFAAALALGFVQAPLTVLAPAEVTGRDTMRVAAPLNGVIDEVVVAPNTPIEEGALLARYDDTELRNALEIADRSTLVARAQLERLQAASFTVRSAARELKIAEAELALAQAESDLAQDRLSQVEIRAPRSGLAVFDNARDLTGRPVSIGERLMEIVDPDDLEVTIRLPVDDSIALQVGAPVRVFLDSNPLAPISAAVSRRSYRATTHEDGSFAYTLTATGDPGAFSNLRLGAQGTAQLFGGNHSLFFIAFRRPYSWFRQTFGI